MIGNPDGDADGNIPIEILAEQYSVDPISMSKVKKKFDEFDSDGSGEIDEGEFKDMLTFFMKVKSLDDVPPQRFQRFWQEVGSVVHLTVKITLIRKFCIWIKCWGCFKS